MREIRTSGSMSGRGNGTIGERLKSPRLSSTLPLGVIALERKAFYAFSLSSASALPCVSLAMSVGASEMRLRKARPFALGA